MLVRHVELHVPEGVHPDHPSADRTRRDHGPRHLEHLQLVRVQARADRLERRAHRKVGRGRCEHVATVEGVGHRMEHDAGGRDLERVLGAAEHGPHEREDAVVRTDQQCAASGADRDGSTFGADTRIHDGAVDGVIREVGRRSGQDERPAHHVLSRDRVGEIDHRRIGGDLEHHAVTHADELVTQPVVRAEHDRPGHDGSTGCRYIASHASISSPTWVPWLPESRSVP